MFLSDYRRTIESYGSSVTLVRCRDDRSSGLTHTESSSHHESCVSPPQNHMCDRYQQCDDQHRVARRLPSLPSPHFVVCHDQPPAYLGQDLSGDYVRLRSAFDTQSAVQYEAFPFVDHCFNLVLLFFRHAMPHIDERAGISVLHRRYPVFCKSRYNRLFDLIMRSNS